MFLLCLMVRLIIMRPTLLACLVNLMLIRLRLILPILPLILDLIVLMHFLIAILRRRLLRLRLVSILRSIPHHLPCDRATLPKRRSGVHIFPPP